MHIPKGFRVLYYGILILIKLNITGYKKIFLNKPNAFNLLL